MNEFLTADEVDKLILALAEAQDSFTEEEGETIIKWAHKVRVYSTILDMALKGKVTLIVDDFNEIRVRKPNGGVADLDDINSNFLM